MGNERELINNLNNYSLAVNNPDYGDMYNAYSVSMYLERTGQLQKALNVAQVEVQNRATPESYDLLAYSYYKMGNTEKALQIVEAHIDGKTFEPGILFHSAEIYKAVGALDKVAKLKGELLGAIYELGPTMESQIKNL
jgi:tetratricopeptide (TPR) repeat protein